MKKLTMDGFSHHLVMVLAIVGFAVVGTFLLVISHADPSINPYSCPNQPTLQRGDSGHCVKRVQWFINNFQTQQLKQPGIAITGKYDNTTWNAVKTFQAYDSLTVNGVTNHSTWSQLNVCASSGICAPLPASSVSSPS